MVTETGDLFSNQAKQKEIDFSVDTSDVRDRFVVCDKNRLNRVLLYLVSNACKFTPEGGAVKVTLRQSGDDSDGMGHYEFRVKDNGIGMSEEFAGKVFDPFERERTSTISEIQGTGLGMAITKSIVDLMGGTIEVITAPRKGTEFIVNISFELARDHDENEGAQKKRQKPYDEETDFSNYHLLLVEDNDINREIAVRILTATGFTLDTAVNGQEAVETIAASQPGYYDLVLMDIQMPVMNGYEATRAIMALDDAELSGIPIVAMTANAFAEDKKDAEDAGMNAHIAKPIDIETMMETIQNVLNERYER
jgi:CheY-like chemotaxis protein